MQTKRKVVLQVLVFVLQMLRDPGLLFVNAASSNHQDVVMLLPEEREEAESMRTVVKPFDVGLWCTIAGSLIYAVSVTCLLEQRISDQSLTELVAQICSRAINMPLSSLNIQNWLARIVISVWVLVLPILTVSYSTNYIVMLNVPKMNVNEILARDGAIGYLKDNFSPGYQDRFENLKAYATEEECAQALSQGPNRGGVGVILMDRLDALHFISRRPAYTYYDIPPQADTPRSLGLLDFLLWFIITGTVSTVGLIKFIFDLLYSKMHRPTAPSQTLRDSDLHGRSPPVTGTLVLTGARTSSTNIAGFVGLLVNNSKGISNSGSGIPNDGSGNVQTAGTVQFGCSNWDHTEPQIVNGSCVLVKPDLSEMVPQHATVTELCSSVRRRAPATELERENRAATSSPFAEGNASPGNDDEESRYDDEDHGKME